MNILALGTSAKAASCAVLRDGAPVASAWQQAGLTHSRTLMPMVEGMLRNSELTIQDMDAIAVAVGPGSFTGLRIGIAAVKGLSWAADKPCVAVSTLEAMATPLSHMEGLIICAMDARRQQVYNALFEAHGGQLRPLRAHHRLGRALRAHADRRGYGGRRRENRPAPGRTAHERSLLRHIRLRGLRPGRALKRKKPPRIGQLMKIIYVWQRAGVVY